MSSIVYAVSTLSVDILKLELNSKLLAKTNKFGSTFTIWGEGELGAVDQIK